MPVILNEPVSALMTSGEAIITADKMLKKAAQIEDPIKRLIMCMIAFIQSTSYMKLRKRKPFNSMLGETYEYVTPDFRFVSEKIGHLP